MREDLKKRLLEACKLNNLKEVVKEVVKELPSRGADIDALLEWAIDIEKIDIAKEILDSGRVDVNARGRLGKTVLMRVSMKGYIELVRRLIEFGANVNLRCAVDGGTVLTYAIRKRNIYIVKTLIEAGANVNLEDAHGWTALTYAIMLRKIDIVKALIEAGANVNLEDADGWTALTHAIMVGKIDIVKELIEAGAKIDAIDEDRKAFMDAIERGDMESVRQLTGVRREDNGKEFLSAIKRGDMESLKRMREQPRVNVGKRGNKDFIEACKEGNTDIVESLIKAGADVDAVDREGKRALMYAYENGNKEVIRVLIEAGADVNAVYKDGGTLLRCLMRENNKSREKKIEYMAMLIRGGLYTEDILEEVKKIDREERIDELDIIIGWITRESNDFDGHMRKVMIKGVCDKEIKDYFKRIDRLNELSKGLRLIKYKSTIVKEKVFSDIENSSLVYSSIIELLTARSQVEKAKGKNMDETDKEEAQEKKDRRKKVNEVGKEKPKKREATKKER